MSRRRRTFYRGALYHVVQRGNRRQAIYEDDRDRRLFLSLLAESWRRFGLTFHAYCLMGNHYHLLVETPSRSLDKGMHWLNGIYATRFNTRHEVDGHLFQDRYWASLVESDDGIRDVARYIVANPLRARLCDRIDQWTWSTGPMMLGLAPRPTHVRLDLLMRLFDAHLGVDGARERFRALVEQEPEVPLRPPLDSILPDLSAARVAGYTFREIAAATGRDPATILRRLRGATRAA